MNILVIGSGGREHAIIRKLKESPKTESCGAHRATAALRRTPSAWLLTRWTLTAL